MTARPLPARAGRWRGGWGLEASDPPRAVASLTGKVLRVLVSSSLLRISPMADLVIGSDGLGGRPGERLEELDR